MNCYTFKEIRYTDGFLESSVDATYILTMEGSRRMESISNQLKQYHPTNRVYIVINKGFKRCSKDLPVQNSTYDIIHANLTIFRHANDNSYKNILILEDDFIFSEKILDPSVQANVNSFLIQKRDTDLMYLLGCFPFLYVPRNFHTNLSIHTSATHAVIFSESFRNYVLDTSTRVTITDWDYDVTKMAQKKLCKYFYRVSLCNQPVEMTENRKNWEINVVSKYVANKYVEITGFDKSPEPGTSILYTICFLINYSLLVGLLFLTVKGTQSIFRSFSTGIPDIEPRRLKNKRSY